MHELLKYRKLTLAAVAALSLLSIVFAGYSVARNHGYEPVQPFAFSHKIHAGDNRIPCQYCHIGAAKSKHALVPSMNVCMNCHTAVKTDSPFIKRLKQIVTEKKEAIQWIKVHDLPDFVRFNHKPHVQKGIACEVCHGDVKKMVVMRQDKPLTMAWCIDCHRGKTAPVDLLSEGGRIPAAGIAPTDCNTCHH